jgi:hypothetical protein
MTISKTSKLLFYSFLAVISQITYAQNTVTSGNWNDPTVWSGGAVPAAGGTVNVNNPITINTNLSPTGVWTFNSNTTDQPGGTNFTFNPNAGTNAITISAGVTVTFGGGSAGTPNQFNSGSINVFGTLILSHTDLNNSGNLNITIHAGGTLIINGDLTNKNNSGTLTINGALIVNGNFNNQTGSVVVGGTGTIEATGTITSNGGSTVFGSQNDCNRGPCSGSTLACTFDNYISPTAVTICSGTSTVTLTSNPVTSNAPAGPTYQWKSSTDNITFSNVGTNSASYTTPTLTQTTFVKLTITSSTPCTSTSAVTKITVLPSGGWLGVTNNWGTASNWCANAVPTSTTDVVITNGTGISAMPVIAAGTSANVRNLTISNTFPASSVTLAASATASLNIFGDFTNNGTFTDNSTAAAAGVKFVGSTAQTVAGTTANIFNNLTFANTSGATPAINLTTNNITVNNTLTMSSGIINMNGFTITIGTAAGSTGTLAYGTGTRFYGGNIERWFPTAAVTAGSVVGLFPIGTATDYRPVFFGNGGLSAGGTIKVRHTGIAGATAVSPTFVDNGGTVAIRSNSFWTVTTGNSIGTGTHSIRTEGTGFGTVGNVNDLRLTLVNTISPGSNGTHAGTLTNPQVNRTGLTTANLLNSFYWGSVNSVQTPLPISLLSFSAKQLNNTVQLNWSTASELNNEYFTVERLNEDDQFDQIALVKGKGTSNEISSYQAFDFNPRDGKNYYRLKQTDFDGTFTFSKMILVEFERLDVSVKIYPIPVRNEDLIIELKNLNPGQSIPLRISNLLGVVQVTAELKANVDGSVKVNTPIAGWPSGMYLVQLGIDSGYMQKIIIE